MNGNEVITYLKQLPGIKHTVIIGITASVIERKERIEFIRNCHGHIDKPVDIKLLLEKIKQLIAIEWIEDDILVQTSAPSKTTTSNHIAIAIPAKETCNKIIDWAEMGDFESINSGLDKLEQENPSYHEFCANIQAHIGNYNSEKIIKYIKQLNIK